MHCLRESTVAILILSCLTGAQARADEVSAPDTPAGKLFAAWLDAVNSGDRATIKQFVAERMAPPPSGALPVDQITNRNLGRFKESDGFALRRISASEPHKIAAFVQAKRTGYGYEISMAVTEQPPHKILGTGQRGVEAPPDLLPKERLSEQAIHERIDALVTKLSEADAFSGAILVAKDGKPFYERAAGFASRAWDVPNRVDTKFNVASIGKMFTAVAVAQLVEQGKLSYDDTVGKVMPDYANKDVAERVTVGHLLSHTSGLPSGGSASNGLFDKRYRAVKDYLPSFVNDSPAFEPGSKFLYSNCGYYLLGAIIEKASGQTYHDYVRAHVFQPAGMTNTDNYDLDTDPPSLATGYMDAPGGQRRSNVFRLPIRGVPVGLGYSTVGDMLKFDAALRDHTLLSEQSLKTIWTGRIETDRGGQYGYGCHLRQYNGARIVWHGGGWVGITNQFEIYPDLGYTVVILCNIDNNPTAIAMKLREWLAQGTNER
ncbi:MAG: serine hydrolase domain-containing protein [Tepidisphaeraceae bacterium]